jgi:S-adenosylmethionine:tRNA ribosyltransferase-isomerase
LPENSLLIVNNSKVFASRLIGHIKTGAKIEIFLLDKPEGHEKAICHALAKPMKKLKQGTEVIFKNGVIATVIEKPDTDTVSPLTIQFNLNGKDLLEWIESNGYIPLPPYIERKNLVTAKESKDSESYQTVYAEPVGSVAAPTAGLHFTPELIKNLEQKNIKIVPITLHVGAGTFMPVKFNDISKHTMHKEIFNFPASSLEQLLKAKKNEQKIFAVGTTSLRCIESLYQLAKKRNVQPVELTEQWLSTDLFLRPRAQNEIYKPWLLDGIITNFHQPCSTLFMLICNLIGYKNAHQHYQRAINNEYRFFSYGDSNLLWL